MCARWYWWVNYSSYTIACLFSPPPPTATTTKSIGRIEHVTTLRKWAFQQNCQQSNIIELASLISFYWLSVSMRFLQVYFACYYGVPVLGKYYLCSSSFALLHISPFVLILATSLKLLLFLEWTTTGNEKWELYVRTNSTTCYFIKTILHWNFIIYIKNYSWIERVLFLKFQYFNRLSQLYIH